MGLFFISLYFILAGMVIFGVFGHIPSHYNSQKKSPQPSKFEQKLKESAQKSHEERLQAEEKLKQTQEKLAQIKAEKAKENRRKEEEKWAKYKEEALMNHKELQHLCEKDTNSVDENNSSNDKEK